MIVYWTIYLVPALITLVAGLGKHADLRALAALSILFVFFFVAFRETGGDYERYLYLYQVLENRALLETIKITEPLYGLLNWLMSYFGVGFSGVTIVSSILYFVCLWRFARREPLPILAVSIAIAYMTIVVVMGYTRQGVAIGLLMVAMISISDKRPIYSLIFIAAAAGFHASAAVFVIFIYHAFDARTRSQRIILATFILLIMVFGSISIYSETLDSYVGNYIQSSRYSSSGALLRLLLSWTAAGIFFYYRRSWPTKDRKLHSWLSLAAMGTLPLLFISSTVADRVGLYLLPLQVIVFGRLPTFQKRRASMRFLILAVLLAYAMVLGAWLHFGNFAVELWLPYRSSILGVIR